MCLPSTFMFGVSQRGGFGQIRGSKQQQPEEEEEEDAAPQNPLGGLFGFGAKKAKVCVYEVHIQYLCVSRHTCILWHGSGVADSALIAHYVYLPG